MWENLGSKKCGTNTRTGVLWDDLYAYRGQKVWDQYEYRGFVRWNLGSPIITTLLSSLRSSLLILAWTPPPHVLEQGDQGDHRSWVTGCAVEVIPDLFSVFIHSRIYKTFAIDLILLNILSSPAYRQQSCKYLEDFCQSKNLGYPSLFQQEKSGKLHLQISWKRNIINLVKLLKSTHR